MAKPKKNSDAPASSGPAHGTLVDARRSIRQATDRGENTFKYVIWAFVALVLVALLVAVLSP
ncbi:MAG: hypothetical protein H6698_04030 [Myxococcales bacterium]|nr:hypothetical protein [Myxococcales bacterium]MCB9520752.1 hypothetical protein [Myxococcales bacterium]MCB9533469.1 hypothetical protein [Myxococcales bacterium]